MRRSVWTMAVAAVAMGGALTAAGTAESEEWHAFSRSRTTVYLADVDSIVQQGDVTAVKIAQVRIAPETAGDRSYSLSHYELRCRQREIRAVIEIIHGANGEEEDRFEEADAPWDRINDSSFGGYVRNIVCEGARANPPYWPSIAAFMDSGRN